MLFWTTVKVAFRSLTANKLRSILTAVGVIIGVASVIAVSGVGAGAQIAITGDIKSMGTNLLLIRPGQRDYRGISAGTRQTMTLKDAEELLKLPMVEMVAPEVVSPAQVKYMNNNTRTTVSGTVVTYFAVRSQEIGLGRSFTEGEVNSLARVAVLGPQTAERLFGAEDPLGKSIKINGVSFRVVGVTKPKGDMGFFNPDDEVFIPLLVAMRQLFGFTSLHWINCTIYDGADIHEAEKAVVALLRKCHRLQEGEDNDFFVRNMSDAIDTLSSVTGAVTLLLMTVAGISLIVGGIGIMNIMLVSVTERTREIGVRKALGARDRDIMRQFLLEALALSLTGGLIGIAFGLSVIVGFNQFFTQFHAVTDPASVPLAFSVSAAVGVFFGWYPASKASRLDPIEALRYE
ncbi:MAG: ABC transporter permease [Candidatus Sumerlaeota bacterium]|nr:ABC transporter permease [Candidatus Sumerlaeota bacterium]